MSNALMIFARTGDRDAYRNTVVHAADSGNIAAELLLAKQYIPEQCTFEPDQDVPHCGKDGNEPPHIIFRKNPLGIEASYEEAARWLEKASAQGSGEASEILAQLITRMKANGHATRYTAQDSGRLHALARSQGFDVEPIVVNCFNLIPGDKDLTADRIHGSSPSDPPRDPFTQAELETLHKSGLTGRLQYDGGSGGGDSVLLMRPEVPAVHVRIILDHDPGPEVLLPMPAHHDEIYVQPGEEFIAFPGRGDNLPRFITLESKRESPPQIMVFTQTMDGSHSGGSCGSFPSPGRH